MQTFFIADTHFGHANILRLCGRPFETVEEMDKTMIELWNARVCPKDEVYILGDFMFRAAERSPDDYLKGLNGKKHLVVGNHDKGWMKKTDLDKYFVSVEQIAEIALNGTRLILCHYPILEWNHFFRGACHVYGHIHNKCDQDFFPLIASRPNMLNAGADINGFMPVTFEELKKNNGLFKERWADGNGSSNSAVRQDPLSDN